MFTPTSLKLSVKIRNLSVKRFLSYLNLILHFTCQALSGMRIVEDTLISTVSGERSHTENMSMFCICVPFVFPASFHFGALFMCNMWLPV